MPAQPIVRPWKGTPATGPLVEVAPPARIAYLRGCYEAVHAAATMPYVLTAFPYDGLATGNPTVSADADGYHRLVWRLGVGVQAIRLCHSSSSAGTGAATPALKVIGETSGTTAADVVTEPTPLRGALTWPVQEWSLATWWGSQAWDAAPSGTMARLLEITADDVPTSEQFRAALSTGIGGECQHVADVAAI